MDSASPTKLTKWNDIHSQYILTSACPRESAVE